MFILVKNHRSTLESRKFYFVIFQGFAGLAIYTGTKFYVEGLSQTLRQEVCKLGIRVTCIQPGDVVVEDREKTRPDPEVLVL